jgi:hypothetical protein
MPMSFPTGDRPLKTCLATALYVLAASLLVACGTSSNFETAKMVEAGGFQAYAHGARHAVLTDSSSVATGVRGSLGMSLAYGFSPRLNGRIGFQEVRLGHRPTWDLMPASVGTPERGDRILSMDVKAGGSGRGAASVGLQRFLRSRMTALRLAGYYNGYLGEGLYLGISPYFLGVTRDESITLGISMAVNATLTWEFLDGFFLRPEAGILLPMPVDVESQGNLGLALGFGF